MKNLTGPFRLTVVAPISAAAMLLAAGCGSTTTTTSGAAPSGTDGTAAVLTEAPSDVTTPSTAPATPDPVVTSITTVAPATTVAPPTTSAPATTSVPAPPVTTAPPVVTCTDFGPYPPLPDSMPTKLFDTDGDGDDDDQVRAYGSPSGWARRVIENGITSDVLLPPIAGFASITGHQVIDGRDAIQVTDGDTLAVYTLGTASGCVELIGTNPPPPPPAPCGTFGSIADGVTITSDLSVALDADGLANDQVITYTDGVDILRTVRNGVISEFAVPDVGVSHIRALGVGNAGEISDGNEVIVKTRSGASGAVIGIFGHDGDGCLFEFTRNGMPLEMYVGATIGNSAGAYCGDGLIAQWEYSLDADGTYSGSGAAYFESSASDFTYLPASDDFSEGLALEDLSPATLDCFGFGL